VLPIAIQFPGHLRRGRPLRETPKDQEDLAGSGLAPVQDGPGPGVEDATAGAALVVQDGVAVAAMDPQVVWLSTPRAGQAVGMEQFEELLIAGRFIEEIQQREIHGGDPPCVPGASSLTTTKFRAIVKGPAPGGPHEPALFHRVRAVS
jgi:hypothetical protein